MLKFSMTIGVNAGYGHQNETSNPLETATTLWQDVAAEMLSKHSLYVSAVARETKTVYHTDWGCPVGGENTVTFEGSTNPAFVETDEELEKWKQVVLAIASKMKDELNQSTVAVEFIRLEDFHYLS